MSLATSTVMWPEQSRWSLSPTRTSRWLESLKVNISYVHSCFYLNLSWITYLKNRLFHTKMSSLFNYDTTLFDCRQDPLLLNFKSKISMAYKYFCCILDNTQNWTYEKKKNRYQSVVVIYKYKLLKIRTKRLNNFVRCELLNTENVVH